jgi:hypothetical protein
MDGTPKSVWIQVNNRFSGEVNIFINPKLLLPTSRYIY